MKTNYLKPYAALNFALGIAVEILFEERKKIVAKSLAEGNAQSILITILKILLKAKVSKPYDFVKGNSCGPLIK